VNIQVQVQDSTGAKTTTPYSFVVASLPVIAGQQACRIGLSISPIQRSQW
jgi:hypothetical protein